MAYTVYYCRQQIDYYQKIKDDYTEDLTKLKAIQAILSQASSKYSSGNNLLSNASNYLSYGFGGYKAQQHLSNLSGIAGKTKSLTSDISSISTDVSSKISLCQDEISDANSEISYWRQQLWLAQNSED